MVIAYCQRTESGYGKARGLAVLAQYAAVRAHDSPDIALHLTQHGSVRSVISGYVQRTVSSRLRSETAHFAFHRRPHVAPSVDNEVVDKTVLAHKMLHPLCGGTDSVKSAVVHTCIYPSASVLHELQYVHALQFLQEMSVSHDGGRSGAEQLLLAYHKHATHVRANPVTSLSVVNDVVSPSRGVTA